MLVQESSEEAAKLVLVRREHGVVEGRLAGEPSRGAVIDFCHTQPRCSPLHQNVILSRMQEPSRACLTS